MPMAAQDTKQSLLSFNLCGQGTLSVHGNVSDRDRTYNPSGSMGGRAAADVGIYVY